MVVLSGSTDVNSAIAWYWAGALALVALHGAGELSFDHLVKTLLAARYPELEGKPAYALDHLPRVVIVGAGFGGLACAAKLANAPVQITLVDRHNYHLFQPLLYQVATAALAPGDIAASVRSVFRDAANVRVLLVQSGPRLLPPFPENLSAVTQRSLEQLGVEVHLNSKVEAIDALGVSVSGRRIAARTVLWAAGVVASPAAHWLRTEAVNAGRLRVEADLSIAYCC